MTSFVIMSKWFATCLLWFAAFLCCCEATIIISNSSNTKMSNDDKSHYILPNNQPVVLLQCEPAFNALSQNEKLYAHYLSRASWYGSFITTIQISPESPLILALLHNIFLLDPNIPKLKETALAANVTEDEFTAFLVYAAGIYDNLGNYKNMGDTKIIPNLSPEKLETIVKLSSAYKQNEAKMTKLWRQLKYIMYALDDKYKSLGLADKGVTTYFSANCTEEDAKKVTDFMLSKRLESVNTRVFKTLVNNKTLYDIRLASIESGNQPPVTLPEESYKGSTFKITRGDYSPLLKNLVENLSKALQYAANDNEKNMLLKYISHFTSGSLDDHKDGSRYWIKDKGPTVETYLGFVETYRDPVGERAEYEGFVAVVDKMKSKKFASLVANAPKFIDLLPWGRDFEKDVFLQPDFTSLDVLTFAGSTKYRGINIPNYDAIRQTEGFKNVYLANIVSAAGPLDVDSFPFISEADLKIVEKYRLGSVNVGVALHELLGHGSGKLFKKNNDGTFNFDQDRVINPLTGKKIDKYYMEGETYDSKFGALGSAYEECRAEAVALYLCLEEDVAKIFDYKGAEIDDVIYVTWLVMMWGGLARSLVMYQPERQEWLQAHSRARFVLLQVCLEAGEDFLNVIETEKGKDLLLVLNREKIKTVGKQAIGSFLQKLQVYKSTGDVEEAKKLFEKYSKVSDNGKYPWASWRNIILARKKPSDLYAQPNTFISDDGKNVILKNYDPSAEGLIQSWIERFPDSAVADTLVELYRKDSDHFPLGNSSM